MTEEKTRRVVLFRGNRLDNGLPAYGDLLRMEERAFILFSISSTIGWQEVDPASVGQLTGLSDRAFHLLYEGDMVRVDSQDPSENGLYRIRWDDSFAGFILDGGDARLNFQDVHSWELELAEAGQEDGHVPL